MRLYKIKFQKSLPTLILALVMVPLSSLSQEKKYSINAQAGVNFKGFEFDYKNHKVKDENGFNLGLEYNYKLNQKMNLGIGITYLKLNSELQLKELESSYSTIDIENETFDFRYKATNIKEKYETDFIQIPIFVSYEGTSKTTYYAQAGVKFTLAVKGNYKQTVGDLKTSGYYPDYNIELKAPLFMGFGEFENQVSSGKLNIETSYVASIEAGIKHEFNKEKNLYVGLFFDYGLNNMLSKSDKELVEYQTNQPTNFNLESVSNSKFAEIMRISSFGVKLKYNIW